MMVIRESVFTTQLMRKTPAKNNHGCVDCEGRPLGKSAFGNGSGYSMAEVCGGLRSASGTQYTSVQNMVAMTWHPRILYSISVIRLIRLG
jgi:hypothetical protein